MDFENTHTVSSPNQSFEPTDAIAAAERAGIDLSLIDVNLSLSVKERWEQHDAALELILKLQQGRERADAELQPTPRDPR
ncbi:MAG: hypothetical protein C0518_08095 [Opitutus sp.]|nr:hypothetical protein [Opitutus sp.]